MYKPDPPRSQKPVVLNANHRERVNAEVAEATKSVPWYHVVNDCNSSAHGWLACICAPTVAADPGCSAGSTSTRRRGDPGLAPVWSRGTRSELSTPPGGPLGRALAASPGLGLGRTPASAWASMSVYACSMEEEGVEIDAVECVRGEGGGGRRVQGGAGLGTEAT